MTICDIALKQTLGKLINDATKAGDTFSEVALQRLVRKLEDMEAKLVDPKGVIDTQAYAKEIEDIVAENMINIIKKNAFIDEFKQRIEPLEPKGMWDKSRGLKEALDDFGERSYMAQQRGKLANRTLLTESLADQLGAKGKTDMETVKKAEKDLIDLMEGGVKLNNKIIEHGEPINRFALTEMKMNLLMDGTFRAKDAPELNTLAVALKAHGEKVAEYRKQLNPQGAHRYKPEDALPIRPDMNIVLGWGKDAFLMRMDTDDMGEIWNPWVNHKKKLDSYATLKRKVPEHMAKTRTEFLEQWYKNKLAQSKVENYRKPADVEEIQKWGFDRKAKGWKEAQARFLNFYAEPGEDPIRMYLQRSRDLLESAEVQTIMGNDINATMKGIEQTLKQRISRRRNLSAFELKQVDNLIKNKFSHLTAQKGTVGVGTREATAVAKKTVSAMLTTFTPLRTALLDTPITGFYGRLGLGQGTFEATLGTVADTVEAALRTIGTVGKKRKWLEDFELTRSMELLGTEINISHNIRFGGLVEDIQTNKAAGRLGKLGRLADFSSKASFADAAHAANKTVALRSMGTILVDSVDRGWDNLNTRVQETLLTQGWNKAEWDALQEAGQAVDKPLFRHAAAYDLDDFSTVSDKALKTMLKPGETAAHARIRLEAKWKTLKGYLGNDYFASLTSRDRITPTSSSDIQHGASEFVLQFHAITRRQYQGLRRNWNRIGHFDPGDPWWDSIKNAAWGDKASMGAAIGAMALTGLAYQKMVGIAKGQVVKEEGREPMTWFRDTRDGMIGLGFGGFAGVIYNNLQFGDSPFAAPLGGTTREAKKAGKVAYKIGQAIVNGDDWQEELWGLQQPARKLATPLNYWYTKLGVDWLMEQANIDQKEKSDGYQQYLDERDREYVFE